MRNKLKHIFTFLAIGLFLFFALASELLDESTNYTVAIRDCMEKPPVTGMVHVDVLYKVNGVAGIGHGKLFLIHQKVKADTTCSYTLLANQILPFSTAANGHFVYDGVPFMHNNSEDLYRIEVEFPTPFSKFGTGLPMRETQVKKYNDANFQFEMNVKTGL